jgi:nucleotide-binding universal stress UspA family protein
VENYGPAARRTDDVPGLARIYGAGMFSRIVCAVDTSDRVEVAHALVRRLAADDAVVTTVGAVSAMSAVADAGADLLVLGAGQRAGPAELIVDAHDMASSPCAVALAPWGGAARSDELARIGVGFDGGRDAEAALRRAAELAVAASARLEVVAAWTPTSWHGGPAHTDADTALRAELGAAAERAARNACRDLDRVELRVRAVDGEPAAVLLDHARHLDLLVVGACSDARRGERHLGSVAARVVRGAPCPVLVVSSASARLAA